MTNQSICKSNKDYIEFSNSKNRKRCKHFSSSFAFSPFVYSILACKYSTMHDTTSRLKMGLLPSHFDICCFVMVLCLYHNFQVIGNIRTKSYIPFSFLYSNEWNKVKCMSRQQIGMEQFDEKPLEHKKSIRTHSHKTLSYKIYCNKQSSSSSSSLCCRKSNTYVWEMLNRKFRAKEWNMAWYGAL